MNKPPIMLCDAEEIFTRTIGELTLTADSLEGFALIIENGTAPASRSLDELSLILMQAKRRLQAFYAELGERGLQARDMLKNRQDM